MLTDGSHVEVAVSFEWTTAARISLTADRLEFPDVLSVAGLYRISLAARSASDRVRRYIGETANLRRRFNGYRNPGPSQPTNQRLHDLLRNQITDGGGAEITIATEAIVVVFGGEPFRLDLTRKHNRLLAENAALLSAHLAGDADIENL